VRFIFNQQHSHGSSMIQWSILPTIDPAFERVQQADATETLTHSR